jgi:hypothetical protein
MGVHRSALRHRRRSDAAETKLVNRVTKARERARRDARIMATLKAGSLPYSPTVMSWLSRKLDKKASRLTQEDVNAVLS